MENIEKYHGVQLPEDFEITELFGDTLMVVYTDATTDGMIKRGSLYVDPSVTYSMWRVGKVLLKGPKCTNNIEVGDMVLFPNDRGIPGIKHAGQEVRYINEDRLFGKVKLKPQE
jgi:hypothetical protein